jgi:hypothetical protein
MTLKQMQREGRERLDKQFRYGLQKQVNSNFDECTPEVRKFLDQHTANVWKAAQESAYKEIEAVFIKQVPLHAFDLEDGVWIKRLLNKAFKNNKHG